MGRAWLLGIVVGVVAADVSVNSQHNRNAAHGLQLRVNHAIKEGVADVFIPPGDYYFGNSTFLVLGAANLTIRSDPGAATLWFWGWLGAVQVQRCTNLTMKGFIVDRNPTPYLSGKVTSTSPNASYTFQVFDDSLTSLPSYWDLGEAHWSISYQYAFSSEGMPQGCGSFESDKMVPLGNRSFRYQGGGCSSRLGIGDSFVAIIWIGNSYNIGNSSNVITQDVSIRASPYMGVAEMDGRGGHVYRNVSITPGPGRLISVNADGIHSEDVDVGPLIEHCQISHLLDDYLNIQNTIHLHWANGTSTPNLSSITLIHPHTGDAPTDGLLDQRYGTSEPLLRLAPGDKLRFYDPVTFEYLGDRTVVDWPQKLNSTANSTLGKQADALWEIVSRPPYDFGSFTRQNYRVARFRSSVFQLQLSEAPPAVANPALLVPHMVEIEKDSAAGAVVRNNTFKFSTGFFGRFKSSHATIEGNRFMFNGNEELELGMLPSYFEGPVGLRNVTITGNTFGCSTNMSIQDILALIPSAENISVVKNEVIVV